MPEAAVPEAYRVAGPLNTALLQHAPHEHTPKSFPPHVPAFCHVSGISLPRTALMKPDAQQMLVLPSNANGINLMWAMSAAFDYGLTAAQDRTSVQSKNAPVEVILQLLLIHLSHNASLADIMQRR
jgi:hypothetical protein